MKQRLLALLLCILFVPDNLFAQTDSLYTQQWNRDPVIDLNATASTQRQIITVEQITASGYNRLSDVFQLIDGWTFTTISGENWQMQSNGVGNYDNPNWTLMVNGQRIDLQRLNVVSINMLGIAVTEVERVEVINSTGLYLGEFSHKGIIHIITRKNIEGVSYRGYYSNGISTTDQGRYQVNPDLPSYINPIGNNTSHAVGFRKGQFNITGSFSHLQYYAPDTNGIPGYSAGDTLPGLVNKILNTRLEAQYAGKKMLHQLQLGYTQNDYTNLFDQSYNNIGYLNQWNISSKHQIRLSVVANLNQYKGFRLDDYNFNTNLNYRYLTLLKNGSLIWQTGLSYTEAYMGSYSRNQEYIFKPYASVNYPLTRKSNLFADGMLSINRAEYAPKFSLGIYKRVSFISNWSIVTAYTEQLDVEDFTIFYAIRNLFNPLRDYRYKSKQLSADVYYNLNIGNHVKFNLSSGVKKIQDEPGYNVYYGIDAVNIYSTFFADGILNYTNWVNRFNVHYDIVKNLVFDFNYMRTGIVEREMSHIRTVPKHKLSFVLQYELPKRFSVWVRGYRQSTTTWRTSFSQPITSAIQPLYYSDVPAFFSCDLGLSKKLFKNYLNLNISARNIFNGKEQYHTAGSHFGPRFTIGLSANVSGLFASRTAKP